MDKTHSEGGELIREKKSRNLQKYLFFILRKKTFISAFKEEFCKHFVTIMGRKDKFREKKTWVKKDMHFLNPSSSTIAMLLSTNRGYSTGDTKSLTPPILKS
jgi:hypothetical protein